MNNYILIVLIFSNIMCLIGIITIWNVLKDLIKDIERLDAKVFYVFKNNIQLGTPLDRLYDQMKRCAQPDPQIY